MKDYKEDDYLMLSGIQHYAFCKRQWALIHIENQWEENLRTIEGNIMHERAHNGPKLESRKNLLVSREMRVFSSSLGISGICDVVEFEKCNKDKENAVILFDREGYYSVTPVEYKKGEPKVNDEDRLQLTAQVMCLEEMLCTFIDYGYLYYGKTRHREKVEITEDLRQKVKEICSQMHQLFEKQYTPKVKRTKACNACSLKNICIPKLMKNFSAHDYILENIGSTEL
ncbi:CRISPR-associated protein Cas4 [Anaerostipes sp.]|uniref:CRISPR-associated protein Cas4 n=1 Tax=Anaerostipes sp. TaxID=1872530 RepID=UPI0025827131|nr:CRISPR-associated protein Cas4 [Anaerostipes sp.]MCI5622629.1 CRISPR-associated protein Cas4 [Anaerostipes sp.]MDY2725939.1 CRISPR-associated protein Cas4 [Anaerostipes faecalis]